MIDLNTPQPSIPTEGQVDMNVDKINDLRRRIVAGETVNDDELRAAIAWLANLRSASVSSAPAAKKPVTKQDLVNAQALLDQLL